MDKNVPLVSIVMPCFNAEPHLVHSVGSVQAQTFRSWELIAVDDGSTDATGELLANFAAKDGRIQKASQPNQGVSAARNHGLTLARGAYVAFLDADDTWSVALLEKLVAAMQGCPDAVLAYCGWQNLGLEGGRGKPFVPPDYETADKAETLFAGCRWPIHAAIAKRQAVLTAGGFDTSLKNAEDYALWLRVGTSAPIVRVPEVLAFYHFHGGVQASSNKARAAFHHLQAQGRYLDERPEFRHHLGRSRVRTLTVGNLLARGYECYWSRDLACARLIFRAVMKHGYGGWKDWLHMLPCWLPESLHRRLIALLDRRTAKPARPSRRIAEASKDHRR